MTGRERLNRVFRRQETDRLAVRLMGVDPLVPRDDWTPLYQLVERHQLEIIRNWNPAPGEWPAPHYETAVAETSNPDGSTDVRRTVRTPRGDLTEIFRRPAGGGPGMTVKNMIETAEDAERWLSLPHRSELPKVHSYWELDRKTGNRALMMVGLDEAMYSVQRLMGSETFGFWLRDDRPLLHRMIEKSFREIRDLLKYYLSQDLGDAYGWAGPELCIPPLASANDFRAFVAAFDRELIGMIHDAGKTAWIHCHGNMKPVLGEFLAMELDCLNPIEPPPMGGLTLNEALRMCAGKMALDGGVQDGAFHTLRPHEMKKLVERTIGQVVPGESFILCPTASPTTTATLLPHVAENYRVFVETAAALR